MTTTIPTTTAGPYIVSHAKQDPNYLTIGPDGGSTLAIVLPDENGQPHWANAAILATAPNMLEALIEISGLLNSSKETIDLEQINELISGCFEKLAAEVPS